MINPNEEPCAGKPQARICAGGGQQWSSLPRQIIDTTSKENKSKIDKLIGDKVQLYSLRCVTKNTYEESAKSAS